MNVKTRVVTEAFLDAGWYSLRDLQELVAYLEYVEAIKRLGEPVVEAGPA